MKLVDKFEPEVIVLDLSNDQHIFGGKLKEKDINTRRRKIKFSYNGQLLDLTGISCRAFIKKPDDTVSYITCPIIDNEYALLDFTTNSRAIEGIIKVELGISLDDQEISTFILDFEVVKSLRDDDAIQSSNEFGALQDIINTVGGLADAQKRLTDLESSTGQLKIDNEQLRGDIQTVTTEITNIKQVTNNLNAENAALVEKISDLTNRVASLESGTGGSGGGTTIINKGGISRLPDWYTPPTILGTELDSNGVPSDHNYNDSLNWILEPIRAANPTYIKRTSLGKDQSNTYDIYKYELTPDSYDKTLLITCCLHGNEYTSFYGLCRFLELLCADNVSDPHLLYLKQQVKLVIVPICNPWGFVNSKRQNSRGVDLNRNFEYLWNEYSTNASEGQTNYKGTAPFSEKESQIMRDLIQDLSEVKTFCGSIDWHTLTTIQAEKVVYYPRFRDNCITQLSEMLSTLDPDNGEDERVIFASSNLPSMSCWASYVIGTQALNPEWNNSAYGGKRNNFLMTRYVEYFVNTILVMVKNSRDKRTKLVEPFTTHHYFYADSSKSTEDSNRYSSDGWRLLNSSTNKTYSTMAASKITQSLDSQYTVTANGWIKVKCKADSTLHLQPTLYQQYSTGQNQSSVQDQSRGEIIMSLKGGQDYIIPVAATIMGFPTCYNGTSASRTEDVTFSIRAFCTTTNAVYIQAFNIVLHYVPTNKGIATRYYKVKETSKTELYPSTLEN